MSRFGAILSILLLVTTSNSDAIVFTRCSLAKALLAQSLPRFQLSDWVCLVESESSRDTSVIGGPNPNGSYDYGLYQINGKYWCKLGSAGGGCDIDCNKLIDDNIADDTRCALIIYRTSGFQAWAGWKKKCQGKLPDLKKECGL